jgi:ABC-type nitrate/sulfonate/bicarbonate transport system substrate-binding protein
MNVAHLRSRILNAFCVCAFVAVTNGAAQADDTVVNVGALAVDTSANVFYAVDQGFFKDVGLDVRIQILSSGPIVAAAVASGAIDIGAVNVASAAAARDRGFLLRFIAPAAVANPAAVTNVMMVSKSSSITSAAQLNGQVIGVNGLKDLAYLSAMSWLAKHGADNTSVKFIEVPYPEQGAALDAHRAAAIVPTEPFTTVAKPNGRILGNALDGIAPQFMILGWAATDAWLQSHSAVAAKFATAIARASVWANAHHRESAAILARQTKVDLSVVQSMTRATYGTEVRPELIAPVIDAAVKYGVVAHPVPADDLIWHAPK